MKIPKDIVGRNKHRDLKILLDWAEGLMTFDGLAVKYELTQRRITQILMANHAYVKIDKDWEKKQRIHYIKSKIVTAPDTEANKLTLQQELRTEIEGDKNNEINIGVGITMMPAIELKDGSRARFNVGD